jgi:sigma-E factor negative regulatory protein RseB
MSASVGLVLMAVLAGIPFVAPQAADDGAPTASELLTDMIAAYDERNFSGRFLYMRAGQVSTLALQRAVIDGEVHERVERLQGPPHEVIRKDGRTVSVHAGESSLLLSSSDEIAPPLGVGSGERKRIPEQYVLHRDGAGRVAGRPVWRLRVEPRDEYRYGYRLHLDQQSHLLLKSAVLNGGDAALERVEFLSLELNPGLERADFALPESAGKAWSENASGAKGPDIRPGWLPEGFALATRDHYRSQGRTGVLQSATYSDGLASFTLFVEPAAATEPDGKLRRKGPTVVLAMPMQEHRRSFVTTLVGEVPPATARRVLKQVRLENPGD